MQATKQFLILLLFGLISTVSYSQNIADTTKAKSDSTKQKEAKRDSTINALSFKMDELAKILESGFLDEAQRSNFHLEASRLLDFLRQRRAFVLKQIAER